MLTPGHAVETKETGWTVGYGISFLDHWATLLNEPKVTELFLLLTYREAKLFVRVSTLK